MNWYKIAKLDRIYNIFKITSDAPEQMVRLINGDPLEIKADSSKQAVFLAKKKYSKLADWENPFASRTLIARLNEEKEEELKKYREIIEENRRKKEERAQEIYDK